MPVDGSRVYGEKIAVQQLRCGQQRFVIDHLHGLGVSGVFVLDLFIAGMLRPPICIAYPGCRDAGKLAQKVLGAPEATGGKIKCFHGI